MPEEAAPEITRQLEEISGAGDYLVSELYTLTDKWKAEGVGFYAVEPVFRFMESHPDLDYGSPGPLVQFAESFWALDEKRRYEEKLIESLNRAPTFHTIWMLNRLINGEQNSEEKVRLISIMQRIANDTALEPYLREGAADFFEWQTRPD